MTTDGITAQLFEAIPNESVREQLSHTLQFVDRHYDLIEKVALFAGLYIASMAIPPITGLLVAGAVVSFMTAARFSPLKSYFENIPSISNSDKGFLLIAGLIMRILSADPLPFGVCLAASFSVTLFNHGVDLLSGPSISSI